MGRCCGIDKRLAFLGQDAVPGRNFAASGASGLTGIVCWRNTGLKHPTPIDYIILGKRCREFLDLYTSSRTRSSFPPLFKYILADCCRLIPYLVTASLSFAIYNICSMEQISDVCFFQYIDRHGIISEPPCHLFKRRRRSFLAKRIITS
jgi:hypothetical protein